MNNGKFKVSHGGWINQRGTYQTWQDMRQRCSNPDNHNFKNYGARGITICERWATFVGFVADMGERPTGKSLDRINNDGNYEPSNCRWATRKEQRDNQRTCRVISYNGQTDILSNWAKRIGIQRATLAYRLDHGWPLSRAMSSVMAHAAKGQP